MITIIASLQTNFKGENFRYPIKLPDSSLYFHYSARSLEYNIISLHLK